MLPPAGVEARGEPWHELDKLLTAAAPQDAFTTWVEGQRQTQELRNDDVTWLAISLG